MLTRRDNLLVRPWQQRRFHHHRKQVESALPVIDVGPPTERGHVACKLKQVQSETERCAQIGRDNCALVLKLAHIMRTSRVDNSWRQPPPTFLRRVGIYLDPTSPFPPGSLPCRPRSRPRTAAPATHPSPVSGGSIRDGEDDVEEVDSQDSEGRNLRCSACHPRTARRRERKDAAAAPDLGGQTKPVDVVPAPAPALSALPPAIERRHPRTASAAPGRSGSLTLDQVVITYKALRLAISFPPHASVRIRSAMGAPAGGRRQRELAPVPARARLSGRTARTAA